MFGGGAEEGFAVADVLARRVFADVAFAKFGAEVGGVVGSDLVDADVAEALGEKSGGDFVFGDG